MRAGSIISVLLTATLPLAGLLLYIERTNKVVLFSHGTPEVPQGRIFSIFNPFRDRTSEHTAEKLMDDLRTDKCEQIVREVNREENYDPRVCAVMGKTSGHSLLWRHDENSAKVLVYAVPEKQARLWIGSGEER